MRFAFRKAPRAGAEISGNRGNLAACPRRLHAALRLVLELRDELLILVVVPPILLIVAPHRALEPGAALRCKNPCIILVRFL